MNCPSFKALAKDFQDKYSTIIVCASRNSNFNELKDIVQLCYDLQVKGYEEWRFKMLSAEVDGKRVYAYYFVFAANRAIVINGCHFNNNFVFANEELNEIADSMQIPNDSNNIEIAFTKDTLGRIKYIKLNPEVLDHKEFQKASKLFMDVRERCSKAHRDPRRIITHISSTINDNRRKHVYAVFNNAHATLGKEDGQDSQDLVRRFVHLEAETNFNDVDVETDFVQGPEKHDQFLKLCVILSCVVVPDNFDPCVLIRAMEMICNNDEFHVAPEYAFNWFVPEFKVRFPGHDMNEYLRRLCDCMVFAKNLDVRVLKDIFDSCSEFHKQFQEDVNDVFEKEFEKKFKGRDVDTFWQLREDCLLDPEFTFVPIIRVKRGSKLFIDIDSTIATMPYCVTIKRRSNVLLKIHTPTNFWHDEQAAEYAMKHIFDCTGTVETIDFKFECSTISRTDIQKFEKNWIRIPN